MYSLWKGKIMKLNNKRHFYLYAKGWYKKGDFIEDLKVICGNYSGCDPEHISIDDIFIVLSKEIFPLIKQDWNLRELLAGIDPYAYGFNRKNTEDYWIRVLRKFISILDNTPVLDKIKGKKIIFLGEPDPDVLPLHSDVTSTKIHGILRSN
jgi:hypothetical protein